MFDARNVTHGGPEMGGMSNMMVNKSNDIMAMGARSLGVVQDIFLHVLRADLDILHAHQGLLEKVIGTLEGARTAPPCPPVAAAPLVVTAERITIK